MVKPVAVHNCLARYDVGISLLSVGATLTFMGGLILILNMKTGGLASTGGSLLGAGVASLALGSVCTYLAAKKKQKERKEQRLSLEYCRKVFDASRKGNYEEMCTLLKDRERLEHEKGHQILLGIAQEWRGESFGALPQELVPYVNARDKYDGFPMDWTMRHGNRAFSLELLKAMDPITEFQPIWLSVLITLNATALNEKSTSLHEAARLGNVELVQGLLEKGYKNFLTPDKVLDPVIKETPVHLAIRSGSYETVRVLLDAGLPLDEGAVKLARESDHRQIQELAIL